LKGFAVPTGVFGGDPRVTSKVKPLPYDVAQAKKLLADAGFPDGKGFPGITFYAPPANDPQVPWIEAIAKMWQDNLGVKVTIQNNEWAVYSTLQWADANKDIKTGYTTLGGPMNWFQPEDLLMATPHIWYFMDFKQGGMVKYLEYKDKINAVKNLTKAGDWAELDKRASDAWAKRQKIIAEQNNDWGELMKVPPTFKEQYDEIAKRFQAATDDKAKLSAYQDGLTLILKEEQDAAMYDDMNPSNAQARPLLFKLRKQSLDQAWDLVVPLEQLAVDTAWMVPIYNQKIFYVTDPHLSGVVPNKLSWGNYFQFQYLQWKE
jgi:ABC-type transport system substrate-binding protein